MCEYRGCQSLRSIDQLTQEHETVVNLISQVEEHGLSPAVAAGFPEKIAALEEEHRRIEAVLAEAGGPGPADRAWPARGIAALDLLRDHILKEQGGVFPAAPAYLSTEQWETTEAVRAQAGTGLAAVRHGRPARCAAAMAQGATAPDAPGRRGRGRSPRPRRLQRP